MKAILILDEMPIVCNECPLLGELEYDEMTKIHEDCPLKEMPEKKDYDGSYVEKVDINSFLLGWNACIEEIEK